MERTRSANAYQSTVIIRNKHIFQISGALALLILLFPPVFVTGYGEASDGPTHYCFLLSSFDFRFFDTVPDIQRLSLEFALLGALTATSLLAFRHKK